MVYVYLGDRSVVFRSWTQHLDLQSMLLQLTVGVEGFNSYTILLIYCNVLTWLNVNCLLRLVDLYQCFVAPQTLASYEAKNAFDKISIGEGWKKKHILENVKIHFSFLNAHIRQLRELAK